MISLLLLALTACTPDGIVTSSAYPDDLVVVCGEAITLNDDTTMSDAEFTTRMEVARDLRHQCGYWNLSFPATLTPVPAMDAVTATTDSSAPDAAVETSATETPPTTSDTPTVIGPVSATP